MCSSDLVDINGHLVGGDILLIVDYTNGGSKPVISVREWSTNSGGSWFLIADSLTTGKAFVVTNTSNVALVHAQRVLHRHHRCASVRRVWPRSDGIKPLADRSLQSAGNGVVSDSILGVIHKFVDGFCAGQIRGHSASAGGRRTRSGQLSAG